MKTQDWIGLLDASYDLSLTDTNTWLRAILCKAVELFKPHYHLGIMTARYTANTFHVGSVGNTGPPEMIQMTKSLLARPEIVRLVHIDGSFQSLRRDLFRAVPSMRSEIVRLSGGAAQDIVGVAAHTGTGEVLALNGISTARSAPTAYERRFWPQIASHLGAALRMRRVLQVRSQSQEECAEAIMDPRGRCHHAKPPAQSIRLRDALRRAALTIDRVRTHAGRRDPAASLAAWRGLVEGRWSLIDHFDTDGMRFVLAIKNDPVERDPRGLTVRERQCAEFIGLGQSSKRIAYTLGISEVAISTHLASVRLKLGLRSNAELGAFFAPTGARARLEEVAIDGQRLVVGEYPLCQAGAVSRLTPAEQAVAALLVSGSTTRDVAARRGTSVRTVANQVQALFRKLGVQSRLELATVLQGGGKQPPPKWQRRLRQLPLET